MTFGWGGPKIFWRPITLCKNIRAQKGRRFKLLSSSATTWLCFAGKKFTKNSKIFTKLGIFGTERSEARIFQFSFNVGQILSSFPQRSAYICESFRGAQML